MGASSSPTRTTPRASDAGDGPARGGVSPPPPAARAASGLCPHPQLRTARPPHPPTGARPVPAADRVHHLASATKSETRSGERAVVPAGLEDLPGLRQGAAPPGRRAGAAPCRALASLGKVSAVRPFPRTPASHELMRIGQVCLDPALRYDRSREANKVPGGSVHEPPASNPPAAAREAEQAIRKLEVETSHHWSGRTTRAAQSIQSR